MGKYLIWSLRILKGCNNCSDLLVYPFESEELLHLQECLVESQVAFNILNYHDITPQGWDTVCLRYSGSKFQDKHLDYWYVKLQWWKG
jgi:hypothetical protein